MKPPRAPIAIATLLLTGLGSGGLAKLPPAAQVYLEQLPEKALTLDLVMGQAVRASDSYRGLRVQLEAAEAPERAAQAPLDTRVNASLNWLDDQQQPPFEIQPSRTQNTGYSLGVSTKFLTGTQVSAEVTHGSSTITFAPGSPFTPPPFTETRGTLGLTQSLWKDFFGAATRASVRAGRKETEAGKAAYEEAREDWFFQLAQVFYQAWLAQAQERAARRNLERQERLLKTVEVKLRRGTSEEPDKLQVLSAKTQAEIEVYRARQALGDLWRNLITVLKLPGEFLTIDPVDIPMKLDEPVKQALEACGGLETPKPAPQNSSTVKKVALLREAAGYRADKARREFHPSLELQLQLGSNTIVPQGFDSRLTDFLDMQFPRYYAAVVFSLPLAMSAERAGLASAVAEELRYDTLAQQARDSLEMDWTNGCLDLHRLNRDRDWLTTTSQNQRRREKLEEERFQIGRASTLQVIQAGGDATQAEQMLYSAQTQLRLAAWKVLRLSGRVGSYLNSLEETPKP